MQLELTHLVQVEKNFPYIRDKMVIDFVNGLDVAQGLNQKQHQTSQSFIKRNLALLSGKTQMAQANINDHMIVGLQACQDYFKEMIYHQQAHAFAISQLDDVLKQTQSNVAEIAHFVADLQEQVHDIHHALSSRIDRLEWSERAGKQVEHLLSAWQAEQFSELSPMGQCFLILDNLKWGDFGFYLKQLNQNDRQKELETLKSKIMIVQKSLLNKNVHDDLSRQTWLTPTISRASSADMQLALQYQGDWSWKNPSNYAMAFTATQYPMLLEDEQKEYRSLMVDMIDIGRVSERMTRNVFE